jgi:hypothetical protein
MLKYKPKRRSSILPMTTAFASDGSGGVKTGIGFELRERLATMEHVNPDNPRTGR